MFFREQCSQENDVPKKTMFPRKQCSQESNVLERNVLARKNVRKIKMFLR